MRPLILTGFILLVVRLLVLNIVLEPTNDEGLWQWNARCDHWDLPAHGILHSALSPVNYWVSRTVFALTSPSIVAKRIFNSLLVAAAAAFALQRLSRAGNPAGAVMFLSWLWLDPYLFRMGSWAILEPLLLAGLVACNFTTMRKAWDVRTAVLSGALAGLLVGVKITVLWLPRCYPVYSRGYKQHLIPCVEWLKTFQGLQVIGRYGAFKYNNQDHSILMGLLAAENITKNAGHDLWSVNTDYESYQESAIISESGLVDVPHE